MSHLDSFLWLDQGNVTSTGHIVFTLVPRLNAPGRIAQSVRAALYNLLGRRLAVVHDAPVETNRIVRITTEDQDLPSGLYLLCVTDETFATTRRLMIVWESRYKAWQHSLLPQQVRRSYRHYSP